MKHRLNCVSEWNMRMIVTVVKQLALDDDLSLYGESGGWSRLEKRQVFTV